MEFFGNNKIYNILLIPKSDTEKWFLLTPFHSDSKPVSKNKYTRNQVYVFKDKKMEIQIISAKFV